MIRFKIVLFVFIFRKVVLIYVRSFINWVFNIVRGRWFEDIIMFIYVCNLYILGMLKEIVIFKVYKILD